MVSKVFEGHSFYHASRYICLKPGAKVLDALGVRDYDFKLMAEDFIRQSGLRPAKTQACFHSVLSFYPGEDPGEDNMIQIAREYLEKLGIRNTQFAVVKHTDRAHLHLHILANLVDNNGKSIKDSWIGLRGKKAAQELTRKYGLTPAEGKNLRLTHLEALHPVEADKYKIYLAITEHLPHCRTLEELEARLLKQGIETQYKYKGQTLEKQGVSFKLGNTRLKGSQIDRKYSLGGLQKALALRQEIRENWVLRPELKQPLSPPESQKQQPNKPVLPLAKPQNSKTIVSDIGAKLLEQLLTPVQGPDNTPYELTADGFKKKRKKKRPHH